MCIVAYVKLNICSWKHLCVCGFSPAEFPTPKTELVQRFQVLYLGMVPVARPIGESDPQYSCRLEGEAKHMVGGNVDVNGPA